MYDNSPMGKISLQSSTNEGFQQKMNDLFHGLKFICAYIYDLLILTKGDCTDHVQKL